MEAQHLGGETCFLLREGGARKAQGEDPGPSPISLTSPRNPGPAPLLVYPKCGPPTSSPSSIWELVRNAAAQASPQPLNQSPHFDRSPSDFTHTFKLEKRCPNPSISSHPAPQLRLRTRLPLFSSKRQRLHLPEPDATHQVLPAPVSPGAGAVSRATYRKVTHTRQPSAFEPQWLPMSPSHVRAPWSSMFHACQRFSSSSLAPSWPPHPCRCVPVPLPVPEMPSLTVQGKAFLFSRLQGEVTCHGKPSPPSQGLL